MTVKEENNGVSLANNYITNNVKVLDFHENGLNLDIHVYKEPLDRMICLFS